ncbi:MAG TPA: cytochrome c biogenesis protein CcdA [Dehalococcoidia bacterium]
MQVSVLVAFGYGVLSFLSPCVLPLIPVYLGSLVGPDIFEDSAKRKRLPIFLHALSFVIGFSVIFTLWGAGSGLLGAVLLTHLTVARQIAGILLIVFGAVMLAALKIPWLHYERRLNANLPTRTSYLRSFLIGAVFPVAWIPCTSPVLGGILLLAGTSQTAWQGAYLLAIYSLGLGLPFLALAIAFDFLSPLLKNIRRFSTWISVVSGVLLIALGILVLTDNIGWFLGFIQS